ncbi:hypothetical protein [Burkholderia ubonensis]|uniref:hypothetical protein n=1 Tax=Burkholderia ubonensis TaxID=101571 RepID=UPI0012FB1C46|nr:hypothetical protein [Burkholderia ubonensis]
MDEIDGVQGLLRKVALFIRSLLDEITHVESRLQLGVVAEPPVARIRTYAHTSSVDLHDRILTPRIVQRAEQRALASIQVKGPFGTSRIARGGKGETESVQCAHG